MNIINLKDGLKKQLKNGDNRKCFHGGPSFKK